MYVQRNVVARSCNHCRSGKLISITYSEYVFVALIIQHAMVMRTIICHLRPARVYHNFPHYLINSTIFEKYVFEHKICFDFLYNYFLIYFSF
jgi:hypothetical protein